MAETVSSTRRALLRAIPATALALSAPSALASALPAPSPLPDLIKAHRAALAAYDAAGDACDAASHRAGYVEERVLLLVTKRDGVHHYGYSDGDIDAHVRARMPDWMSEILGRDMAAERTKLASRLKAELAALRAENNRREAAENLPTLYASLADAAKREIAARVAVLACRPRDTAEAELKAAYFAESEPFRDNWLLDDPADMRALLALLAQPEGAA